MLQSFSVCADFPVPRGPWRPQVSTGFESHLGRKGRPRPLVFAKGVVQTSGNSSVHRRGVGHPSARPAARGPGQGHLRRSLRSQQRVCDAWLLGPQRQQPGEHWPRGEQWGNHPPSSASSLAAQLLAATSTRKCLQSAASSREDPPQAESRGRSSPDPCGRVPAFLCLRVGLRAGDGTRSPGQGGVRTPPGWAGCWPWFC